MSGLYERILEIFEQKGWTFEPVADRQVIRAQFEAHHTRVPLHVQAFPPIGGVHVVATSAHPFEPVHLGKLSELLLRSSQQLTVGNFEMDWDHRLVLFRVANLFDLDQPIPARILEAMVHAAVAEMDRITPALSAISSTDPAGIAKLDVPALMVREEWVPPVGDAFQP